MTAGSPERRGWALLRRLERHLKAGEQVSRLPHLCKKRPKFLRLSSSRSVSASSVQRGARAADRQPRVGQYPQPCVFEVEAVVDVKVPVEPEALAHQSHVAEPTATEREAVCLHRVHLARLAFALMKVLQVLAPQPVGSGYSNPIVVKQGVDGPE